MLRSAVLTRRVPACFKALQVGLHKHASTTDAVAALQLEEHNYAQTAAARTQLQLPTVQEGADLQLGLSSGLETYLRSRGCALSNDLEAEQPGPALRIMSHMLTFPLTLAYALQQLHSRSLLNNSSSSSSAPSAGLNIVCIGARAEASLPVHLWTEAVLACNGILGSSSSLSFIGPELQLPQSFLNSSSLQHTVQHNDTALTLQWQKQLYHAAESSLHNAHSAEVYVLYNPGLGHPALSSSWSATIDAVISSGKLIILTGHSELDAARDAQWLQNRYSFVLQKTSSADCDGLLSDSNTIDDSSVGSSSANSTESKQLKVEWVLPTAINPFRSLRKTVDATEGGLVVSANAFLHAIRLAPAATAA
jgi:hypothetical protein